MIGSVSSIEHDINLVFTIRVADFLLWTYEKFIFYMFEKNFLYLFIIFDKFLIFPGEQILKLNM